VYKTDTNICKITNWKERSYNEADREKYNKEVKIWTVVPLKMMMMMMMIHLCLCPMEFMWS
jgi:hypothetical protein